MCVCVLIDTIFARIYARMYYAQPRARVVSFSIFRAEAMCIFKIIPTAPLDELSTMLPHIYVADIKV